MTAPYHSSVFVGRQQIYDRDLNTVAYELLFRTSTTNQANVVDGDAATSQLLINAVVDFGLENLVFGKPAFVNFTRNFLTGDNKIPFDADQLVIEVLENIEPTRDVIDALQRLKSDGFTIALDDYIDSDNRQELLELSDVVKFELPGYDLTKLADEVRRLKKYPLKLLAEKVETTEEFERCKSLGFDYFQGYFLSRPQVVQGRTIANNQIAILRLLVKLRDPAVTFDEVVDLIKQDVGLSIKLLRYVNSLAHGVRHQIDSVRQAAIRLGLQKICQIVTLIAMNGISDKPRPLLETALVRARMCEILGGRVQPELAETCFTVGLFSNLDAFLDEPLQEILKELPISPEIREALLSRGGKMGRLLNAVTAFERGDWEQVRQVGVEERTIQDAYLSAASWAHQEAKAAFSTTR